MAVRKEREPYACGLDAAVDVVGGKWKPMILWALYAGRTLRFGELRRHIPGVSEKMLIQQLRELESDGIVHREVYREVPPKVEYSLTDLGQSLNTALLPLGLWGDQHMEQIVAGKAKGRADGSNGTGKGTGKGTGTRTDKTDTANKAQNAA
ncbi:winged helix-turn-helix transcriptional regulator [Streptomyces sp. NPDC018059]|uniref:winged helix-turn-helix transcriptional regulator n=1 Tax=Streptomyces sp. NPDC018059 TaxID=3365041 RepID=UPI0037ADC8CC